MCMMSKPRCSVHPVQIRKLWSFHSCAADLRSLPPISERLRIKVVPSFYFYKCVGSWPCCTKALHQGSALTGDCAGMESLSSSLPHETRPR